MVVKRRKLETQKFENIDWQRDWWWEVTHGCWPLLVQGHMEGNTWTGGSYPFQPQTTAEVPTQHEDSTWSTRRENGRGPWLRGGSVPERTRRHQVWGHRGVMCCHWGLFNSEHSVHHMQADKPNQRNSSVYNTLWACSISSWEEKINQETQRPGKSLEFSCWQFLTLTASETHKGDF